MLFRKSSQNERTDFKYTLTTQKNIDKAETNNTIYIDPQKPFATIQERCTQLKNKLQGSSAVFKSTLLPSSLKRVFITYISKELYNFDKYKKERTGKTKYFIEDDKLTSKEQDEITFAIQCTNIARDLQNEPSNLMSPEIFCQRAKNILQNKTKITVLGPKEMKKEGLNLVLAIGNSSKRTPRFLVAELLAKTPKKDVGDIPTICIIGKTVVYDAGGLNIKLKGMTPEMKTDKTGGCVALCILKYFTKFYCNCNLVVICPVVENILSEDVVRPGDIVKSHNGKMVEITDTDAEGRLILADAISFSTKYNPKYILDFATLTGWADTVHPDINAVCYTKDISLASLVNEVGESVGERVWFLPHWDEYIDYAKSTVANVKNDNDAIRTGAYFPVMFMMHFVPEVLKSKYLHFDICHNWQGNLARGNCVQLGIELIKKLAEK